MLAGSSLYWRSSSSRYELDVPSRKLSYILLMGTGSGSGGFAARRELLKHAHCVAVATCCASTGANRRDTAASMTTLSMSDAKLLRAEDLYGLLFTSWSRQRTDTHERAMHCIATLNLS